MGGNSIAGRWSDPYIQTLQPKGRLVLIWAQDQIAVGKQIILEDAALETGVRLDVVQLYLQEFIRNGQIGLEKVDV